MAIKNKLTNFFGLAEDEFMEVDQHQMMAQEEVVIPQQAATPQPQTNYRPAPAAAPQQPKQPVAPKVSMTPPVQPAFKEEKKVVEMRQQASKTMTRAQASSKIMILEPRVYSESMTIAKHILSGEAVLVNFHLIDEAQARRIVDFLTGVVYAQNGDIKRVGDEIFLCTPEGTEIDGAAHALTEAQLFDI